MTVPRRWVLMAGLMMGVMAAAVTGASAHDEKLPKDALTLVRQASALLAQNPGMTGEVTERLELALKSKEPEGVMLDQVREALSALEQKDVPTARRLLLESIMPAGMPMPPESPGRAAGSAPAAPTPAPPAAPSVDVAMKMTEPLSVRFTGSSSESILLAVAFALIGLGGTALWRGRSEVRP